MSRGAATEHAVAWLLRQQDAPLGDDDRAAFDAWLALEVNSHAFAAARGTWDAVSQVASDPVITAERARILRETRTTRRWRRLAAAASLAAVVLCAGVVLTSTRPWDATATGTGGIVPDGAGELIGTRIGERSSITLADGSIVTLNTDSAVRVAYTAKERRIVLERGQAFFEVARHQPQPFAVYAGSQRVVATGTAFDVRLDPLRTQVVLIEGEVHVGDQSAPRGAAVILHPGQKLLARGSGPPEVSAADLDQATSWTTGRLIFRDTPLRDAVEEINRYSDRKIVLADPEAGALPVSGVFFTGQPARFARALAEIHPLAIREGPSGGAIVLSRR